MATAQEMFKEALKNEIGPELRKLGFRGSGQVFEYKVDDWWAQLGFQKSQWNEAKTVSFTMNVSAISKKDWAAAISQKPQLPMKPSPSVHYGIGWQKRIGSLIPGGKDKWWEITPDSSLSNVSKEVIEVVRKVVVPELDREVGHGT